MSITFLLVVTAFLCTIGAAVWRVPIWIAVILLVLLHLLEVLPR